MSAQFIFAYNSRPRSALSGGFISSSAISGVSDVYISSEIIARAEAM